MTEISDADADHLDAHREQGGPAFPLSVDDGATVESYYGMSLRDWFAGQVVGAFGKGFPAMSGEPEAAARYAYQMADAMLKAREEKPHG